MREEGEAKPQFLKSVPGLFRDISDFAFFVPLLFLFTVCFEINLSARQQFLRCVL